jgi:hypothetical protein
MKRGLRMIIINSPSHGTAKYFLKRLLEKSSRALLTSTSLSEASTPEHLGSGLRNKPWGWRMEMHQEAINGEEVGGARGHGADLPTTP